MELREEKRMALRKRKRVVGDSTPSSRTAADKIARLLGLLLIKDIKSKVERVTILRSAGFEVSEVADMLGMTPNHVMVADHHGRKSRKAR
jgi:hypothetical protein